MLDRKQFAVLIGYGLALWAAAAGVIRFTGPYALGMPVAAAASYVATVPACWLSIVVAQRLAALAKDQLVSGAAAVCAVAMGLDGIVLMWAPDLYGADDALVRAGGAWLLWGYGISFAIALFLARPRSIISDNIP